MKERCSAYSSLLSKEFLPKHQTRRLFVSMMMNARFCSRGLPCFWGTPMINDHSFLPIDHFWACGWDKVAAECKLRICLRWGYPKKKYDCSRIDWDWEARSMLEVMGSKSTSYWHEQTGENPQSILLLRWSMWVEKRQEPRGKVEYRDQSLRAAWHCDNLN